jgi:hypothetical protein
MFTPTRIAGGGVGDRFPGRFERRRRRLALLDALDDVADTPDKRARNSGAGRAAMLQANSCLLTAQKKAGKLVRTSTST